MAFMLSMMDETIKVVVSKDTAINCDEEAYQEYLKDLDESRLNLEGDPTRFVLKKHLAYSERQHVMNSQASLKNGEVTPNLGYVMDEVKLSLVEIENPATTPDLQKLRFKDKDRKRQEEKKEKIVAGLSSMGVLMDLFNARSNASESVENNEVDKKKSKQS